MPTYCYSGPSGKVHDRFFPMGEQPKTIEVDGEVCTRSFQAERAGVPATRGWPLECIASGVHQSQAGELRAELEKRGVPTEVSFDGNPIYRSVEHRRRALAARGLFDRASYY